MAENLFPEGYETEVITDADRSDGRAIGYRNGISFDYELGDFTRDGRNRMLDSDGIESWRNWCINCLQTDRYTHLAYSTDFGIEIEKAMKATSQEEAENILTREISEALLADPYGRTAYVEDLVFDWTAPDTVSVKATIQGINDVSIDLEAYITRGDR